MELPNTQAVYLEGAGSRQAKLSGWIQSSQCGQVKLKTGGPMARNPSRHSKARCEWKRVVYCVSLHQEQRKSGFRRRMNV
ncbi:hypothetical protein E2C01_099306 [Portunus trituberculatus]|uniref:Uncharacterized protein n=1 Tax=Portunus trituberculatus TaxID=210409 RepID=A0A5B7K3I3_PORTR|nr:hypothetical protein [Portunus trituberculatus]